MLLFVSFGFICFLTCMIVFYTYINRNRFRQMTGMMISMVNSMISSIAIGTIFGIYVVDKDLTLPTMIAVSIGIIVGYMTGRPISLIAALEGMTAGVMGGMMGAMLGVMIPSNHTEVIICFIVVVDLLVNVVLFRVISEEMNTSKFLSKLLTITLVLVLMGFLTWLNFLMISK
ncbi:putative membrane protein [Bacillus sp. SORGH_AS 510]|uniref:hypothetical protein n=1 Tax=Bacillus sp. SORGH_AS_0510 TaxID=3041771 RepID=UPI00277E68E2|nr:hypothetical protein [Bacillus sp. SORGH_AS_0510]MDQ1146147.1 putative membrane protein [Bacillus sp. SORGH_AS_0510]